jgi:DNA-binding HxlR family transcriptional regulator
VFRSSPSSILLLRISEHDWRVASISKARNPTPLPGRPVRGSRTGRAANALLDLLGRRWALRILWELRHEGTTLTFRELQTACGDASSSVINDRLRELREAGIVDRVDGGYALTPHGRELKDTLLQLEDWAQRWARRQPH